MSDILTPLEETLAKLKEEAATHTPEERQANCDRLLAAIEKVGKDIKEEEKNDE